MFSVEVFFNKNQILIFPNPTDSEFVVDLNQALFTSEDKISLFSMVGEKIYSTQITANQTKINLSNYNSGL